MPEGETFVPQWSTADNRALQVGGDALRIESGDTAPTWVLRLRVGGEGATREFIFTASYES